MARKLFESQGIRKRSGGLATGVVFVVYSDEAGTALADISATVGAGATSSATVAAGTSQVTTANIAGLAPAALRFYGPDAGTDTLYVRVPSDTSLGVQKINAYTDARLDALEAGSSGIPGTIFDAKGDIIAATAADTAARLAVGANGTVLTAASGQATGLQWTTPTTSGIQATIVDAKGDIIAASAADTVARLAAGTDGQILAADSTQATGLRWIVNEGPLWLDDPRVGAVLDGVTDDGAAFDVAKAMVKVAGGLGEVGGAIGIPARRSLLTNRQLVLPNGTRLVGAGRKASFVKAGGSFPTSTAVIRLGEGTGIVFGCRVEELTLDCNDIVGSVGVYSNEIQEQSGLLNAVVYNYRGWGVDWAAGASIVTVEHSEIFPSTSGSSGGIRSGASGQNSCRDVSIVAATGTHGDAFLCAGGDLSLYGCHVEGHVDGAEYATSTTGIVDSLYGHASVTNLLHLTSGCNAVEARNLVANSGTNILVDDFTGLTVPGSDGVLRSYIQAQAFFGKTLIRSGAGSPEGVMPATPGSLWPRTDGARGTSLYIKEFGTGTSGWAPVEASAFHPGKLPNLGLWLAADRIVGLADAAAVATWEDASFHGRNATQATAGNRPTYQTNELNTRPVVRFDGTNDSLGTAAFSPAGVQPTTIVMAFKLNATPAGAATAFIYDGLSSGGRHAAYATSAAWAQYAGVGFTSTTPDTSAHVRTDIYNGASSDIRIDGASTGTGNTGTEGIAGLTLGTANNGTSNPASVDIAEVVVYHRLLAADERALVERYLGAKYGITVA